MPSIEKTESPQNALDNELGQRGLKSIAKGNFIGVRVGLRDPAVTEFFRQLQKNCPESFPTSSKILVNGRVDEEAAKAFVEFQKKSFPTDQQEWDGILGKKTLAMLQPKPEPLKIPAIPCSSKDTVNLILDPKAKLFVSSRTKHRFPDELMRQATQEFVGLLGEMKIAVPADALENGLPTAKFDQILKQGQELYNSKVANKTIPGRQISVDGVGGRGTLAAFQALTAGKTATDLNLKKSKVTVVLDGGHGGKDPGAITDDGRLKESDVNDRSVTELKKMLEKQGYHVVLTKEAGEGFESLQQRRKAVLDVISDLKKNDRQPVFFSMHADSYEKSGLTGDQAKKPKGATVVVGDPEQLLTGASLAENMGTERHLQYALDYAVLRENGALFSALIEVGFMHNFGNLDLEFINDGNSRVNNIHDNLVGLVNGLNQWVEDDLSSDSQIAEKTAAGFDPNNVTPPYPENSVVDL